MLILVGMFYLSIGCLASAMTKNQIVAATVTFAVISLMFFSGAALFPVFEGEFGVARVRLLFLND